MLLSFLLRTFSGKLAVCRYGFAPKKPRSASKIAVAETRIAFGADRKKEHSNECSFLFPKTPQKVCGGCPTGECGDVFYMFYVKKCIYFEALVVLQ